MKVSTRISATEFQRVDELLARARRRAIERLRATERLRAEREVRTRAGSTTQDARQQTVRDWHGGEARR